MKNPWTNVYGAARSLLAAGLLMTLACNPLDVLFASDAFRAAHRSVPLFRASLFYLMAGSRGGLDAARWIAAAALVLVIAGWRPRVTGLLHWYVAFSFAASTSVTEGGDQVHAILALLLLPVALTDGRRWVWEAVEPDLSRTRTAAAAIVADSCFTMIRLQVAVIYFHAAVAKLFSPQWANGTAVYYWFTHPVYGMSEPLRGWMLPVLDTAAGVTALTWGVMLLELTLASALVMDSRRYRRLLLPGLGFHFGIVVAHGLFSFFFAMAGALVLYLRPYDAPFSGRPLDRLASWWRHASSRLRPVFAPRPVPAAASLRGG
jgi:antimicrobial peptide system SdpB family protein